jgi:hypothetical protein
MDAAGVNATEVNATEINEGRKQAILIAATILAVRKLAQTEQPGPARESCIYNSIYMAEKIMKRIDQMWPDMNCWSPGTKPEVRNPFDPPEESKSVKPNAKDAKNAKSDANANVKAGASAD